MPRRFMRPLLLLCPATLLLVPTVAPAQIVLGGGRITVGAPTDFSVSQGHGNYPGGNGFVPGYGYYPNYSNDPERQSLLQRWFNRKRAAKLAAQEMPPQRTDDGK